MIYIMIYIISFIVAAFGFVLYYSRKQKITLADILITVFLLFSPIVNSLIAMTTLLAGILVIFDKLDKIIIIRRK